MDAELMESDSGGDPFEETLKPQKQLIFNSLLPYADEIDRESQTFLSKLKENLTSAVLLRELRPGISLWACRLNRYIGLYGLKFSLDDHVRLIELFYELVIIPGLEASMISLLTNTLISLLKKQHLISPQDLQLPWKPLYHAMRAALDSPNEDVGLLLVPSSLDDVFHCLVKHCRPYFPPESTKEMLNEWRPNLCPFDTEMAVGIRYFEIFLPTVFEAKHFPCGPPLWFEEFIGLWKLCHNQPKWEVDLIALFARLADNNIGTLCWESVMPMMFSKILHNFNLPVCYRNQRGQVSHHKLELGSIVTWIVANLGGGTSGQDHLSALFKTLESYYHPSNMGPWHPQLNEFLRRLPSAFVKRLHRERSDKKSWVTPIPESHKLSDDDVERFVQSVLPAALLSMFSRAGASEASMAFHQLAQLRPELVIPPVLDRLYTAFDLVTEPHRFTAAMQAVVSVARPLVMGGSAYPDGPSHVIPLLMASLPGVDPNDIRKTAVTLQLVTTIANLVPIVDSSSAVGACPGLSDQEMEICSQTANFEDFVLQFIDRCFNLIDSSSLEQTRMDKGRAIEQMTREETLLEVGLSATVSSLLAQCSEKIFDLALAKLHKFVGGRSFEPYVAGKFAAHIVGSVTKVNPEKVLKMFLPSLFVSLEVALTDDVLREERLGDEELLFNLRLLSELVRGPGQYLLPYTEKLVVILDKALQLTAQEGYLLGGLILSNTLRSLTLVYHTNGKRLVAEDYERPHSEYLPIRDWGKPGDIDKLQIDWHVPNDEERSLTSLLLNRYLRSALKKLEDHAASVDCLTKESLQRTLSHTLDCIMGSAAFLSSWIEGEAITTTQSRVDLSAPLQCSHSRAKTWHMNFSNEDSLDGLKGKHIRSAIVETISKVVNHLLSTGSDNTGAFFNIIAIYGSLIFDNGVLKAEFDTHQKNYQMVKKFLGCNLIGRKMDVRQLLVDRVQLQHELRVLQSAVPLSILTKASLPVLKDLIRLAQSCYSEVRKRAQAVLSNWHVQYPIIYQVAMEDILQGLKPGASHEQLKGTLYILAGRSNKQRSLLVTHNWTVLSTLWPAIVEIPPTEKISVIQLLDSISTLLARSLETTSIKQTFTDSCIRVAQSIAHNDGSRISPEDMAAAADRERMRGQENEDLYLKLVDSLTSLLNSGSLHWRRYKMAFNMMVLLLRVDVQLPATAVNIFTNNLVSDALAIRKLAIKGVAAILKQHKRKHPKITVDPVHLARQFGSARCLQANRSGPGEQWDNSWMQYDKDRRPLTADDWNQPRYVHKTHYGYYAWPAEMQVYAPESQQPPLDRSDETLTAGEAEIRNFFSNSSNIEKLIKYLSLEDRKGKDKFGATRFSLFKGLFRNHGDEFLDRFRPHLERLVCDQHEASQRCAAEIITGLIRGAKHWPFAKVEALWTFLCPLLRKAFANVTIESINDWGVAIATSSANRDPNRSHWLMELVLEDPIRHEQGSFTDSSRLYMLQGGIAQQEWRVSELLSRLLNLLRPYLNHPYQNVRDRLGSVLTNIFLHDVPLPEGTPSWSPKVEPFVHEMLPQLACLLDNGSHGQTTSSIGNPMDTGEENRNQSLRLLKTISQWLAGMFSRGYCSHPEVMHFLPYLCSYESNDNDRELARDCSLALCFIAQTVLRPTALVLALKTIQLVAVTGSWKAKVSALEFLQVLTFNNLFNVATLPDGREQITTTVLQLLMDARLEVREKGAQVLGGLLHCSLLDNGTSFNLLETFRKKVSGKIPRSVRAAALQGTDNTLMVDRHSGILGLCSFVDAHPYDVPEYLPDVLVLLGNHLNDPQPIPTTIKKTLSNFKRTHHDSWQLHKQKFSDDQLVVMTDLLVSPNYYA